MFNVLRCSSSINGEDGRFVVRGEKDEVEIFLSIRLGRGVAIVHENNRKQSLNGATCKRNVNTLLVCSLSLMTFRLSSHSG